MAARGAKASEVLAREPWRRSLAMVGLGAAIGLVLLTVRGILRIPDTAAEALFTIVHPVHVFVAAAMTLRLLASSGRLRVLSTAAASYVLAIAIVEVADSLLPYLAEWLLALPSRHVHVGFVEIWWLVHPMAIAGIAVGLAAPRIRFGPGFVLASNTLPPLFDMMMAMWKPLDPVSVATIALFTGLSVGMCLLATAAAAAAITRRGSHVSTWKPLVARYLEAMVSKTGVDPAAAGWYPSPQPCRSRRRTGLSSNRPR